MNADTVLLQKKYCRVIERYADINQVSLETALSVFYHSDLYSLIHDGTSNIHCMSDEYMVEEMSLKK